MTKYYIICLEEKSRENTLLFWKPKGQGYTSNINLAGLFDKTSADSVNKEGRDIALTGKQLSDISSMNIYTVADCPFQELFDKKEELGGDEI